MKPVVDSVTKGLLEAVRAYAGGRKYQTIEGVVSKGTSEADFTLEHERQQTAPHAVANDNQPAITHLLSQDPQEIGQMLLHYWIARHLSFIWVAGERGVALSRPVVSHHRLEPSDDRSHFGSDLQRFFKVISLPLPASPRPTDMKENLPCYIDRP